MQAQESIHKLYFKSMVYFRSMILYPQSIADWIAGYPGLIRRQADHAIYRKVSPDMITGNLKETISLIMHLAW